MFAGDREGGRQARRGLSLCCYSGDWRGRLAPGRTPVPVGAEDDAAPDASPSRRVKHAAPDTGPSWRLEDGG